jgi:EPS-associated MarR family transcriptional regulator
MFLLKDKYKLEILNILRKIESNSTITQRKLAQELGYSLGKLNYIIKKLKSKGILKIKNFKNNSNKIKYIYLITPKGAAEKSKIAIRYIKIVSKEYDNLKKDIKNN